MKTKTFFVVVKLEYTMNLDADSKQDVFQQVVEVFENDHNISLTEREVSIVEQKG
jgi:mannitol/fructose-specific phosphotransferase system IIA component (Ntr-type)